MEQLYAALAPAFAVEPAPAEPVVALNSKGIHILTDYFIEGASEYNTKYLIVCWFAC